MCTRSMPGFKIFCSKSVRYCVKICREKYCSWVLQYYGVDQIILQYNVKYLRTKVLQYMVLPQMTGDESLWVHALFQLPFSGRLWTKRIKPLPQSMYRKILWSLDVIFEVTSGQTGTQTYSSQYSAVCTPIGSVVIMIYWATVCKTIGHAIGLLSVYTVCL